VRDERHLFRSQRHWPGESCCHLPYNVAWIQREARRPRISFTTPKSGTMAAGQQTGIDSRGTNFSTMTEFRST